MTIGLDPAYRQTSVNARELWDSTDAGKAEKAAQERKRAEKEKADRIQREINARKRSLRLARM